MLFDLPFSTYDQARELGYDIRLDCLSCHRKFAIDLADPRLAGKSFAGGVRFRCTQVRRMWSAHPPTVCNRIAHVKIYPPADKRVSPGDHGVRYCSLGCGTCEPGWSIDQMRPDDPMWAPLNDKRFKGYRCPTCRRGLWPGWHGNDTRPYHAQLEQRPA